MFRNSLMMKMNFQLREGDQILISQCLDFLCMTAFKSLAAALKRNYLCLNIQHRLSNRWPFRHAKFVFQQGLTKVQIFASQSPIRSSNLSLRVTLNTSFQFVLVRRIVRHSNCAIYRQEIELTIFEYLWAILCVVHLYNFFFAPIQHSLSHKGAIFCLVGFGRINLCIFQQSVEVLL